MPRCPASAPAVALVAIAATGLLTAAFGADTGRTAAVRRPAGMALVPAGTFVMGSSNEEVAAAIRACAAEYGPARAPAGCNRSFFDPELPKRRVFLRAFALDRLEVSVAEYRACVRAGACDPGALVAQDPRLTRPEGPMTGVTWDEAVAFCRAQGKRLPTEAEWEKAARGGSGRLWPWGGGWDPRRANHGRVSVELALRYLDPELHRDADGADGFRLTAPVGSFPAGASPYGVLDLAGNAAEWTADVFALDPPQARSAADPRGPAQGPLRTVRGGSFLDPSFRLRAAWRGAAEPGTRSSERGFRCAKDR
ncbi:MAG TPA: SUMF1/EgtB/PvdO family nonheme iron enzyme [Polyangia bacterium]|jgi:formylglycine-generating enzyme required for sulfatase activity